MKTTINIWFKGLEGPASLTFSGLVMDQFEALFEVLKANADAGGQVTRVEMIRSEDRVIAHFTSPLI